MIFWFDRRTASNSNGDGFGALLSFELDGTLRGEYPFDNGSLVVDSKGASTAPLYTLRKKREEARYFG